MSASGESAVGGEEMRDGVEQVGCAIISRRSLEDLGWQSYSLIFRGTRKEVPPPGCAT